jgi:tRNA 2-thiouridine synthesizing protein D
MIFSIIVSCSSLSPGARSALKFIDSSLKLGHTINRVFFYQDGVLNANALSVLPQDEISLTAQWQKLREQHNIELIVCVAASLRRGVIDNAEAKRYQKAGSNLVDGFELSGLGQLVDATLVSDRVITFK